MLALSDVRLPPGRPIRGRDDASGEPALGLGISFAQDFSPGEITVVLGANRAGKTDLCRLIAGLQTTAQGLVSLDGDLLVASARHQYVSMVYQSFVNYPNLTVAQNIASPLVAGRIPRAGIAQRVGEMAERLRISDLLDRAPHELSGGQQQRVAIARTLAKNARVVLLDEPLVNLDFKLREALEVELRDLLAASGAIVVYTSSEAQDAFTLGDRLLLLNAGEFVQFGVPQEIYTEPASMQAMSMLCDFQVNEFVDSADTGVRCALRPEHVYLSATASTVAHDLSFDAEIRAFETNGDRTFVHCAVAPSSAGGNDAATWLVRHDGMLDVKVGQQVQLIAHNEDVRRFAGG